MMCCLQDVLSLAAIFACALCSAAGSHALAQAASSGHSAAMAKQASADFRAGYEAANAGDLEKARRSFADVVRLEPKIPEGHAALGSVLLSLGRPEEAAAELKRGLAMKPDDANMKMNLALAEVRAGRPAEALPLFKALSSQSSALPPELEIGYAQALTQTGQRQCGTRAYTRRGDGGSGQSRPCMMRWVRCWRRSSNGRRRKRSLRGRWSSIRRWSQRGCIWARS